MLRKSLRVTRVKYVFKRLKISLSDAFQVMKWISYPQHNKKCVREALNGLI